MKEHLYVRFFLALEVEFISNAGNTWSKLHFDNVRRGRKKQRSNKYVRVFNLHQKNTTCWLLDFMVHFDQL